MSALSAVRSGNNDLTPFLIFGLKGIALQCHRLFTEIKKNMERALFRNMMYDLFNRLESSRKRVIRDRQIEILKVLLEVDSMDLNELVKRVRSLYRNETTRKKLISRDLASLIELGAIRFGEEEQRKWKVRINPKWPQEITESAFFEKIKTLPKSKTYSVLT